MRSLRVPAADGIALHVLEWSREGVPMLFVHGFGNEAHVWDDVAPSVAPYYRTLAVDLRGHGDSDRHPDARYDYDAHVEDLEAVTAGLGCERLVLVGHSLGGRVALLFAARHPDRLAGLVLVDCGPELDPRGVVRIQIDSGREAEVRFASPREYVGVLARAYPAARPETLTRMAEHGLRREADGRWAPKLDPAFRRLAAPGDPEQARVREATSARTLWEALERVTCPTLVVRGAASDVLAPQTADRMEEMLPQGRLAVVPQAGHSVMVDNPEGFRDALTGFVLADA